MDAIYIPQLLKAPERKEEITIQDLIPGLETLTPVRGSMVIRHGGNYLEVSVEADTITTLTCDRCLKQYNHRLSIETSEIIWLEDTSNIADYPPSEREVHLEDLSETLSPDGYFQPDMWLYEQLSLAMPMQQLCGENCQGTEQIKLEKELPSNSILDSRWASLESLKKQL